MTVRQERYLPAGRIQKDPPCNRTDPLLRATVSCALLLNRPAGRAPCAGLHCRGQPLSLSVWRERANARAPYRIPLALCVRHGGVCGFIDARPFAPDDVCSCWLMGAVCTCRPRRALMKSHGVSCTNHRSSVHLRLVHHARIDRRRAPDAKHILQRPRGGQNARLAARRAGDLQADRQLLVGEPAGQ